MALESHRKRLQEITYTSMSATALRKKNTQNSFKLLLDLPFPGGVHTLGMDLWAFSALETVCLYTFNFVDILFILTTCFIQLMHMIFL